MDAPELLAVKRALAGSIEPSTVVLVEGASDQVALETLARRRGRDLGVEGVAIVPMGGATTIGHFLDLLGPHGHDYRLAGLCDAGEEGDFRRELERAGMGLHLTRADMESRGFFVCVSDLEEELIRALGPEAVIEVIDEQGELGSLRILQRQPFHRDRAIEQVLWRFMGTRSGGRRITPDCWSKLSTSIGSRRPLDGVLDYV